jgi:hypothetical protein
MPETSFPDKQTGLWRSGIDVLLELKQNTDQPRRNQQSVKHHYLVPEDQGLVLVCRALDDFLELICRDAWIKFGKPKRLVVD